MSNENPFIKKGDRVRYIARYRSKYRYDNWPEGAWMEPGVEGEVVSYHEGQPAVVVKGKHFESIPSWATVRWDHGGETAILAEGEGKEWEQKKSNPGKEPWQMTKGEFTEYIKTMPRSYREALIGGEGRELVVEAARTGKSTHQQLVEKALSEGKPIPPEVLADYPELVKD